MLKKIKKFTKDWSDSRREHSSRMRTKLNMGIGNLKTLTMCNKCYAFYYKNSWHLQKPKYLENYSEEEVPVIFTECAACLEQENAMYDYEVGSNMVLG